jgi:metal-responsive CopG/Arc/MetJ family transcriptional regulator
MPESLIAEADAWAAANDTGRSEAIRRLVEIGLQKEKRLKSFPAGCL